MQNTLWPPVFETSVRRHLPMLGDGALEHSTVLSDAGLDSLRTISLLVDIEDALDVSVPDEILLPDTFRTAGSLWTAIEPLVPRGA